MSKQRNTAVWAGFWSVSVLLVILLLRLPGQSSAQPAPRVELPEKRTEFSRTYRNPDGSLTAEISQEQLHYKDSSGRLRPIDADLVAQDGGWSTTMVLL